MDETAGVMHITLLTSRLADGQLIVYFIIRPNKKLKFIPKTIEIWTQKERLRISKRAKDTVYHKIMTGDKLRVVRRQKQHSICDVSGSEHHALKPRELPIKLLQLLHLPPA